MSWRPVARRVAGLTLPARRAAQAEYSAHCALQTLHQAAGMRRKPGTRHLPTTTTTTTTTTTATTAAATTTSNNE
jgi:hypothetical protein